MITLLAAITKSMVPIYMLSCPQIRNNRKRNTPGTTWNALPCSYLSWDMADDLIYDPEVCLWRSKAAAAQEARQRRERAAPIAAMTHR